MLTQKKEASSYILTGSDKKGRDFDFEPKQSLEIIYEAEKDPQVEKSLQQINQKIQQRSYTRLLGGKNTQASSSSQLSLDIDQLKPAAGKKMGSPANQDGLETGKRLIGSCENRGGDGQDSIIANDKFFTEGAQSKTEDQLLRAKSENLKKEKTHVFTDGKYDLGFCKVVGAIAIFFTLFALISVCLWASFAIRA